MCVGCCGRVCFFLLQQQMHLARLASLRLTVCIFVIFLVQAWYPAMCVDNLDKEKHNKFQLLGK